MTGYSNEIVARALRQVRNGKLPCSTPRKEYGGPGENTPCDICGEPIQRRETEIEAIYPEFGTLHLHAMCMNALREACAELHDRR